MLDEIIGRAVEELYSTCEVSVQTDSFMYIGALELNRIFYSQSIIVQEENRIAMSKFY